MKKSKHYALLILSACMLFFGCEKDPTASFSVSATLVETNQVVAFTNSSVDADHYEWYFGDGTMSTDVNPTHSYSQAGYYIVTLIAYSKSGRKMDDAYRVFLEVVNPTQLTITVFMDGAPLNGCQVVLFDNYTNWLNNVSSVASATTNSLGKVTFTGCTNTIYYADFYYNSTYYGNITTSALTLHVENTCSVYLANKQITFNNPTYTPITINVSGFASRSIPAGGSTTYQVSGSSVTFTASTSGSYSDGSPMALTMNWSGTVTLSGSVTNYTLNVGTQYFFMYLSNNTGYTMNSIYSNYGNSSYQVIVSASIPSNNVKYNMGYHHALYNTQVRAFVTGGYYYWTNGVHFNFPNTSNQSVWFTASKSTSASKDELFNGVLFPESRELEPFVDRKLMFKETPETVRLLPNSFK
jgi:hypothetical protein